MRLLLLVPFLAAAIGTAVVPIAAQTPSGGAIPQTATPVATYAGPAVGDTAPDVTLPVATRFGLLRDPVKLSALRGQTVVLAFFPAARTSGCTIQMEKYRDQYATLFPGSKVVVLAVSVDADTTLASWASEAHLPMLFGSDREGKAGAAYGAYDARVKVDRRLLYVIGPDGRIVYTAKPFNVSAPEAYAGLGEAVRKTL